jgi:hypothetical protein
MKDKDKIVKKNFVLFIERKNRKIKRMANSGGKFTFG